MQRRTSKVQLASANHARVAAASADLEDIPEEGSDPSGVDSPRPDGDGDEAARSAPKPEKKRHPDGVPPVAVDLAELRGIIHSLDPGIMSASDVLGVLNGLSTLLQGGVWRKEILKAGFYQRLVKYLAHDQTIGPEVLTFFFDIFRKIDMDNDSQNYAKKDWNAREAFWSNRAFTALNLNLPVFFKPNLRLAIDSEESHITVFKTAYILAWLCREREGRKEVQRASCPVRCLQSLLKPSTPPDVLVQIMMIICRCLEHDDVPVDSLKIPTSYVSETQTDYLSDLLDVYLVSEYRQVQKWTLGILTYLAVNERIRMALLQRDILAKLAKFLERKEYRDLHGEVYSIMVLLWLNQDAVMITACNGCSILKSVASVLQEHMLTNILAAKLAVRVLHDFTFRVCRDPQPEAAKGKHRRRSHIERIPLPGEVADVDDNDDDDNDDDREETPSQVTFLRPQLLLLCHHDLDIVLVKLVAGMRKFGNAPYYEYKTLTKRALDLLVMWWKELPDLRLKHLFQLDSGLPKELLYLIGMAPGKKSVWPDFPSSESISLLAIKTIAWVLQELPVLRSTYVVMDTAVERFVTVASLHQYHREPAKYAIRILCSLLQDSKGAALKILDYSILEVVMDMLKVQSEADVNLHGLVCMRQLLTAATEETVYMMQAKNILQAFISLVCGHCKEISNGRKIEGFKCYIETLGKICCVKEAAKDCFQVCLLDSLNELLNSKRICAGTKLEPALVYPGVVSLWNTIVMSSPTAKFAVCGILEPDDSVLGDFCVDTDPEHVIDRETMLTPGGFPYPKPAQTVYVPMRLTNEGLACDVVRRKANDPMFYKGYFHLIELIIATQICFRSTTQLGNHRIQSQLAQMARIVFHFFGGDGICDAFMEAGARERALDIAWSGPYPLTALPQGSFLHRALLYKVLCDKFGIPCKLIRAKSGRRAWSLVSTQWPESVAKRLEEPIWNDAELGIPAFENISKQISKEYIVHLVDVAGGQISANHCTVRKTELGDAVLSYWIAHDATLDMNEDQDEGSTFGNNLNPDTTNTSRPQVATEHVPRERSKQQDSKRSNPRGKTSGGAYVGGTWFSVDLAFEPRLIRVGSYADMKHRK
eukprot:scpid17844/ scgid9550/ 